MNYSQRYADIFFLITIIIQQIHINFKILTKLFTLFSYFFAYKNNVGFPIYYISPKIIICTVDFLRKSDIIYDIVFPKKVINTK